MKNRWVIAIGVPFVAVVVLALARGGDRSGSPFDVPASDESGEVADSASAPTTTITTEPERTFKGEFTDAEGYRYEVTASDLRVVTDFASARPGSKNVYLQGSMSVRNLDTRRQAPYYKPLIGVIFNDRTGPQIQKFCNYDWPYCLVYSTTLKAVHDQQKNLLLNPGGQVDYVVDNFDFAEPLEIGETEDTPEVVAFVLGLGTGIHGLHQSFSPETGEPHEPTAGFMRSRYAPECTRNNDNPDWCFPPSGESS